MTVITGTKRRANDLYVDNEKGPCFTVNEQLVVLLWIPQVTKDVFYGP